MHVSSLRRCTLELYDGGLEQDNRAGTLYTIVVNKAMSSHMFNPGALLLQCLAQCTSFGLFIRATANIVNPSTGLRIGSNN